MTDARPVETPAGQWTSTAEVGQVVIGTPCYGGVMMLRHAQAVTAAKQVLAQNRIVCWDITTEGESLIGRGRDTIAAEFLANPSATHLVFIDSDITFEPDAVLRLIAHDEPVMAGLYPKKLYPIEFVCHPRLDEQGGIARNPRTGAIDMELVGTGFLCIKRHVFLDLIEAGVVPKYDRQDGISEAAKPWLHEFFPDPVEDGIKWSEDYQFCRLWRRLGGRVWIDPAISLGHIGLHEFRGDPSALFGPPQP